MFCLHLYNFKIVYINLSVVKYWTCRGLDFDKVWGDSSVVWGDSSVLPLENENIPQETPSVCFFHVSKPLSHCKDLSPIKPSKTNHSEFNCPLSQSRQTNTSLSSVTSVEVINYRDVN